MKIKVINPNTTATMTQKIGEAARAVAAPGTEIIACNPSMGPVSIEGLRLALRHPGATPVSCGCDLLLMKMVHPRSYQRIY